MHKCPECGIYTLEDKCPKCSGDLKVIYPPKFSVEDKYGKYRRILKKEAMKAKEAVDINDRIKEVVYIAYNEVAKLCVG